MRPTARGEAAARAIVLGLFVLVPLAASKSFGDQFTSVKWYLMQALALCWLLVEVYWCRSARWPLFVVRHCLSWILLGILLTANCLRSGLAWGAQPLLDRACFFALALCFFWYFARNGEDAPSIRLGLMVSASLTTAVGLAQVTGLTRWWGLEPLLGLDASDGRSALFGNANMTAQFLGLSLLWILCHRFGRSHAPSERRLLGQLLLASTLAYVFLLGCRSVLLAVACALLALVWLHRPPASRVRSLALTMLAAAAMATAAVVTFSGTGVKARSNEIRSALWRQTLRLAADHPLGVGSGDYAHRFIPYQLAEPALRSETLLFASPHNEYLRALVEDGVIFCALAGTLALLAAREARQVRGRLRGSPLLSVIGVFLAVEAFFQFPLGVAFGHITGASLLGLMLYRLEPANGRDASSTQAARASWKVVTTALAALLAVVWGRSVISDWLSVRSSDVSAQETACRLNPRSVAACVDSAWLRARAGEGQRARAQLTAVLDPSPHYHPALKLMGEIALQEGDVRAGCFYLQRYRQLFRISQPPATCAAVPGGVSTGRPIPD